MTVPLVLDCDTGIDDALAILYGAAHGAQFRACTVTHGNVPVAVGARNTLTILDAASLPAVPVFAGAARPLAQPLQTAELVHGTDGLGDAGLPASARSFGDQAAVQLVRLVREHPGELTLVAIGPFTNLALALLLEPRLPELVRRVVVMGGAVNVPGNSSELAEANVWHDPEAAQLVIDAGWDVVFVGLEATMPTALPAEALDRIAASRDPRAVLAWRILQHYLDIYEQVLGVRTAVVHDAVAMALALDPDLADYRTVAAWVETGAGRSRGVLAADLRGFTPPPSDPRAPGAIRLVERFDTATFHARLLAALGA